MLIAKAWNWLRFPIYFIWSTGGDFNRLTQLGSLWLFFPRSLAPSPSLSSSSLWSWLSFVCCVSCFSKILTETCAFQFSRSLTFPPGQGCALPAINSYPLNLVLVPLPFDHPSLKYYIFILAFLGMDLRHRLFWGAYIQISLEGGDVKFLELMNSWIQVFHGWAVELTKNIPPKNR